MEVRLLGPVEATTGAGPVTIGSTLQRGLLAMLALGAGRAISTDALIDGLWGDEPPKGGVKSLRFHVLRLRRALMDDHGRIVAQGRGYALEVAPDLFVDAVTFETAVAEARSAASPTEVADRLRCALDLWRGPPLSDVAHLPFADAEIRNLEERRLTAVEAMIDAALSVGGGQAVLRDAERLAHAHPLREPAWALLVRCLYQAGRQADALAAYERLRTTLVEELGIGPGPALQRLELDVLRQAPSLTPSGPAPSTDPSGSVIPVPLGLMQPEGALPMVGRDAVAELLASCWERAVGGARQVVFVSGEPGVGKSRLAAEMARMAADGGGTVLFGRCDEEVAVAYQPFAEALGHYATNCPLAVLEAHVATFGGIAGAIVPELGRRLGALEVPEGSDPQSERRLLFDALASLLSRAADASPVLLVLDDLHWASKATLLLLHHLLRAERPQEILVLATYRDTDLDRRHPLAEFLADLRRSGTSERVSLGGLDEAGVQAMVEAAAGEPLGEAGLTLASAVYAETDGNPFFVGEVLRHLADSGVVHRRAGHWVTDVTSIDGLGIPEGVREVVGRRVGRLSDDANAALAVAAVIGAEFDLRVVERVTGLSADRLLDAVDEAIAARLVVEVAGVVGRCRFGHALVRQTLYAEASSARRAQLHRRVGAALASLYAADLDPHVGSLAYHFAEGARSGDTTAAVDWALRAAADAVARTAFEEAEPVLERALSVLEFESAPDLDRKFDLLMALADVQLRMVQLSFRDAAIAAAAAVRGRDPVRLARAASLASRRPEDDPEVEALCEEALHALGDADDVLRAELLAGLSIITGYWDPERVLALAREAMALAIRVGAPAARARATYSLVAALGDSPDVRERMRIADEQVEASRSAENPFGEAWARDLRAGARLSLGDRLGFEDDHAAVRPFAERVRSLELLARSSQSRALLALLDGRFDEVEALAGDVLASSGAEPAYLLGYFVQMAMLRSEQGRIADFLPGALDALANNPGMASLESLVASFQAELGDRDEARRLLEPLVADECAKVGRGGLFAVTLSGLTTACAWLGDSLGAAALQRSLLPYSGQLVVVGGNMVVWGATDRYLGMLESVTGDRAAASAHFEAATRLEEGVGAVGLVARTQFWHARMLVRGGDDADRTSARALLVPSLATAKRLGMAKIESDGQELLDLIA